MEDATRRQGSIALTWKQAWSDKRFRTITTAGSILLLIILASLPFFFSWIEQRPGFTMNDRLLQLIPARDVSVPTFIIIWSMTLFLWLRCVQEPWIFVVALVSFILLTLTRMISISLVPLEPPPGLIPLKDPLSSIFYGGPHVFITRDLFFSGHTSMQLMMFFAFKKKGDKLLALLSSLSIGTLVLVQHVHYTIDVAAAFVCTYFICYAARKICVKEERSLKR
ncbi:MAG: hypothetical protein JO301_15060 [Chitinophagaceae bacterium]|nr:hypothetical protein [Chitinophagaceae bacterium]